MRSVGGYFELELRNGRDYYEDAVCLNSGRNALEYIIIANNYDKIYIPYFTCDVLLEPFKRNNIAYEFYHINKILEPEFDYKQIKQNEAFLYTNYFGIMDDFIEALAIKAKNLIIDNAQSFYSSPLEKVNTFYSPRKFFGMPDGAYAFSNFKLKQELPKDEKSIDRMSHLLKRLAFDAETGYSDFSINDRSLVNQPMMIMSDLTKRIARSIDYNSIAKKRIENYKFYHENLAATNLLKVVKNADQIPMVYPYQTKDSSLRKRLLENKIYTAQYWPNVKEWVKDEDIESMLFNEIIALPVDQRYGVQDIEKICKLIMN